MQTRTVFRGAVCALLVFTLASMSIAQMSGTYTIDPTGSGSRNFQTFGAAVTTLTSSGVSGSVVFNVASTTFKEAVLINTVSGVSSSVTVSFIAAGAGAVIDATGQTNGLTINAPASYLIFNNLKVRNASGYGLNLNGSSSSRCTWLKFLNCEFEVAASSSSSVRAAHLYYPDDTLFRNTRFLGGGRTLYTQQINRCLFDTCEFDGKNLASQVISPWNSNDSDNCYINCFIHDCGPSGYGMYINYSQYGNIYWNNTIIVNSSNAAVLLGSCCAWSRCNSFRNNIVIQQGTGPAMIYGMAGVLEYNDLDYNCYYAPNATSGTVQTEGGLFQGTLAAWKAILKLPGLNWIPPGGGSSWDQNSIEADPVLVSATAPYDIHLQGVSPCVNGGTTNYIPGGWVSFPPPSHPFLPTSVTLDYEGQARGATPDIGADEVTVTLVGTGSGLPGTSINFALGASPDAGLPYQMGSSLGNGPIPIDTRKLGLSPDALLVLSATNVLPTVFQGYAGVLDGKGAAAARLNIPNIPVLKGTRIYTAFVTLRATAPSGISNISNSFLFTVQ